MSASPAELSTASLFDLSGRSALITGATGSLGSAVARALAGSGVRLTLAGGRVDALEQLAGELGVDDGKVTLVARRPHTEQDTDAMVQAAVSSHGRLDFLLTAAGQNRPAKIQDQAPHEWQEVMDANVRGTWLACRSAGRQMLQQGDGGRVVLVSSTRGRLGLAAGYSAYCTSKAAIDGLTRTLACEWGPHGIAVNAIAPALFRSPLTAWMYGDQPAGVAAREGMLARTPLGRLGEPEDMVGTVLYLLSPAAAFLTGQVIYVDGGYTAG
ncbi:MAG TPA: SDR family oxidoreductase [Solirubrobacteraceae bacterium]|nr:SDR family oxidoreductase [Solirubrobacteraceae bacterium]